jgi:hypothetical protein
MHPTSNLQLKVKMDGMSLYIYEVLDDYCGFRQCLIIIMMSDELK